jgi:integrase
MPRKRKNKRESKGAVLKEPLTPKQQEAVIKAAQDLGTFEGFNALHLTLFLLKTGIHPSVLANKQKSSLKTTEDEHIQWSRPKKSGGYAITRVKISKDLKPWVYDFVLQEFPTYREWYWGFCKKLGKKAGIPELSPMSFRHTFGCNLDELGLAPSEIQALMNCSLPVLMRYTKRQERETDKKLEDSGW